MKNLLLASLVTLSATTTAVSIAAPDAARAPLPSPMQEVCVAGSLGRTPLWKIEMKSDVASLPTWTTTVTTNGAWSYDSHEGKKTEHLTGCLDRATLGKLETALAPATWKTTPQRFKCMAYSASYTTYSYRGRQVLTQRVCDGNDIDQATSQAIVTATSLTNVFALTGRKPEPPAKR